MRAMSRTDCSEPNITCLCLLAPWWVDRIDTMTKRRIGKILIPPGSFVTVREKLVADFLATRLYKDIIFLVPNRHRGSKTPDIEMDGLRWEIKSPRGKSPRTIENNLRLALKQSPNIILDLRRMDGRVPTRKLMTEIRRQFALAKSIKHIIVITRQDRHIDIKR